MQTEQVRNENVLKRIKTRKERDEMLRTLKNEGRCKEFNTHCEK